MTLTSVRPAVPEHWATEDGYMRLCVAKGTLVPAKSLRCGQPQASQALRPPPAHCPSLSHRALQA